MKLIIVLIMFFISFFINAQSGDELLNLINKKVSESPEQAIQLINKEQNNSDLSNKLKISIQMKLAKSLYNLTEYEKSYDIYFNVKSKAVKLGFELIEAQALSGLARTSHYLGDDQSSLLYYKQAYLKYKGLGEQISIGESLEKISNAYLQLGSYALALEYSLNALKTYQLVDSKRSKQHLASLNNLVGGIHWFLKDYIKAIKFYQQAIDIAENEGNLEDLSSYYLNKGEAYIEIEKYILAEEAIDKGVALSKYNKSIIGYMHNLLGKLFLAKGLLDMSLVEYDKALIFAKSQDLINLKVQVLHGKTKVFISQDNSRALVSISEALIIAEQLKRPTLIRDSHQLLYEIYSKQQNFEQAIKHRELYHLIDNQMREKESQIRLVELSSSIEIEQKQHKIESLKKDSALQSQLMKAERTQRNILLSSTVGSLLLLFAFYRRHHHKKLSIYLQAQVEAKTKHIKTLSEIGREITSSLEVNNIVNIVYQHIKELFDGEVFSIGIYKQENNTIEFPVTIENNQHLDFFSILMTESERPAVQCIIHRCEVLIGQKSQGHDIPPPNYKISVGIKMSSAAYIPLCIESKIIGCLTIQKQIEGGFSTYQLDMMRTISAYTAIAIDNALSHEALKKVSNTDFLTKLANRRAFIDKAQFQIEICKRNNCALSFAIADIDKFKVFNDTYGHDGGDFVLKEVANLFKCVLREQDLVARWGGEEFVFMFPNTSLEDAEKVLEKIRVRLENEHYEFNGQDFSVTSTFGVTQVKNNFNIGKLIDIADSALYEGKKNGRNKVVTKLDDVMLNEIKIAK
ncbi:MAG: diguanylate cyclase [Colwellia sp.]|nr:diguanylate cyclase [Colwellia sp.]